MQPLNCTCDHDVTEMEIDGFLATLKCAHCEFELAHASLDLNISEEELCQHLMIEATANHASHIHPPAPGQPLGLGV